MRVYHTEISREKSAEELAIRALRANQEDQISLVSLGNTGGEAWVSCRLDSSKDIDLRGWRGSLFFLLYFLTTPTFAQGLLLMGSGDYMGCWGSLRLSKCRQKPHTLYYRSSCTNDLHRFKMNRGAKW